ncbi:hypothetical protein BJ138DRAFT_964899, partial [Hygrophoropsis aurantiaca]
IPEGFQSDDAVSQDNVQLGLFTNFHGGDTGTKQAKWEDLTSLSMKLSAFERSYQHDDQVTAINLLKKRVSLNIDDHYMFHHESDKICWNASQHYLDFLMVVSRGIGLDACLP